MSNTPTSIAKKTIASLLPSSTVRAISARRADRPVHERHGDIDVLNGDNWLLLNNRSISGPVRGFYYYGGCDLPSLFHMAPLLEKGLTGSLAMYKPPGGLAVTRSDRLLQLLDGYPRPDVDELTERLRVGPNYFEPKLFEPTFSIPVKKTGDIPKTVVALSSASDLIRPLYRRKSTGTLLDPGGWWLNRSPAEAMRDQDTMTWFREEFEAVARPTPESYTETFSRVIRELKERCRPEAILVVGTLTVEPADPTHNYQFRPKAEVIRRRRFRFALEKMADSEGFHLVDVDRVLKMEGIDEQLDFAHFPESSYPAIAADAYSILSDQNLA